MEGAEGAEGAEVRGSPRKAAEGRGRPRKAAEGSGRPRKAAEGRGSRQKAGEDCGMQPDGSLSYDHQVSLEVPFEGRPPSLLHLLPPYIRDADDPPEVPGSACGQHVVPPRLQHDLSGKACKASRFWRIPGEKLRFYGDPRELRKSARWPAGARVGRGIRWDDLSGKNPVPACRFAVPNHPLKGPAGTMVFRRLQQDLLRAWQTLCENIP
eukprot:gene16814-biopygen13623